jgi:predicted AAA+ superfamily ATPase
LRDSGIVHYFLNIENALALKSHPSMGASWEGFVIEHLSQLKSERVELNFYRSHNGAEIDVVFVKSGKACAAAEIKYGDKISPSRGNFEACETLNVKHRFLIRHEGDDFESGNGFKVVSFKSFISNYLPRI